MRFVLKDYQLEVRINDNEEPYILVDPIENFPGTFRLGLPPNIPYRQANEIKNYLERYIRQIEYMG